MAIGVDLAFHAAKSSMQTQQKEMALIANNIANVNSKNYHRKEAVLSEESPVLGGDAYYGTGVHVAKVVRYYDEALEKSLQTAQSNYNYQEAYATSLSGIEDTVLPDGNNFLQDAVNNFTNAVQDVGANPESLTARNALIGSANSLAQNFNRQYSQLDQLRQYLGEDTNRGNGAIKDRIDELNNLSVQMSLLNDKINVLEEAGYNGQQANDLRDRRDQVVLDMSKLADVTVTEEYNGKLTIEIDGHKLIDGLQTGTAQRDTINFTMIKDTGLAQAGSTTTTVVIPNTKVFTDAELTGRMINVGGETRVIQSYDPVTFTITLDNPPLSVAPTPGVTTYEIYDPTPTWGSDSSSIAFSQGEINGYIDARQYIVDKMHGLHLFAIDFANIVNSIQRTGTFPAGVGNVYDLDGNAVPSPPAAGWQDYTFFSADTPGNMTVGITDPRKIAASTIVTETGNGLNMGSMWEALDKDETLTNTNVLNNESAKNYATTFAGDIAVDIQVAQGQVEITDTSREMFQNAVFEYSSVNMDEEMTNMLEVQKSYQAAAKMITILDSMLVTIMSMV